MFDASWSHGRRGPANAFLGLVLLISICLGIAVVVSPENTILVLLGTIAIGLVAALAMWAAKCGVLLISALVVSFVLTVLRTNVGLMVLEVWQVVFFFCFARWAVSVVQGKAPILEFDEIGIWSLFVVVSAWLSFVNAFDTATWFKRAMLITCFYGLYMFLVIHIRSYRQLHAFLMSGFLACVACSAIMLFQTFDLLRTFGLVDYSTVRGTFANANQGATYIVMFLGLIWAFIAAGRYQAFMKKWLLVVGSIVCVIGVVLTRSRTALFAVIIVAIAYSFQSWRFRFTLFAMTLFLALSLDNPIIRFAVARPLATFGVLGDPEYETFVQGSTNDRFYYAEIYWQAIKAYPIFGMGAGNYAFIGEMGLDLPRPPQGVSDNRIESYIDPGNASTHNGFVSWWAEAGLIGFIPFVGSLIRAIWLLTIQMRMNTSSGWSRPLTVGIIVAIIVFILTNLTGEFGIAETRYWLLLAMTSIALKATTLENPSEPNFFARKRS